MVLFFTKLVQWGLWNFSLDILKCGDLGCLRFQDSTCYEYVQRIADPTHHQGSKMCYEYYEQNVADQTHHRGTLRLQCWLEPLAAEVRPTLEYCIQHFVQAGLTLIQASLEEQFSVCNSGSWHYKNVEAGFCRVFFFKCSSQFLVLKWKTGWREPEQLFQEIFIIKKRLVNWPGFFILILKMGRNS